MNKKELIDYCNALKENKSQIINCIDVNGIIKRIEQLDEPQKVKIPQFVADWIEECKNDDFHLFGAMEAISLNQKKLDYWFREDDNMELFARAWLDGYEVEKEKRYQVKMKGNIEADKLVDGNFVERYFFAQKPTLPRVRYYHTKKQLEKAGFGEVFNSPLFEVKEVTE